MLNVVCLVSFVNAFTLTFPGHIPNHSEPSPPGIILLFSCGISNFHSCLEAMLCRFNAMRQPYGGFLTGMSSRNPAPLPFEDGRQPRK